MIEKAFTRRQQQRQFFEISSLQFTHNTHTKREREKERDFAHASAPTLSHSLTSGRIRKEEEEEEEDDERRRG